MVFTLGRLGGQVEVNTGPGGGGGSSANTAPPRGARSGEAQREKTGGQRWMDERTTEGGRSGGEKGGGRSFCLHGR